jgi:large subunit ribosomal protein L4
MATDKSGKAVKIDVKTPAGKTEGSVELPAELFDAPANIALLHQVVTAQLAAKRQGTHSTKTRGEVRGGGRKPYRQKGTGRARQGSNRAPQFTGGGISHGPKPRDYAQRTPKKMKAAALRGALSDRARAGLVHVVSAFIDGDVPSTKAARTALATVVGGEPRRALVVLERGDEVSWLSLRNLPGVHVLVQDQLNTYDVLVNDVVVFTRAALDAFLEGPIAVSTRASRARAEAGAGEPVALAKTPAARRGETSEVADEEDQ